MNLKELSKKLDLSQTTVSRALNGYPEVSAETRERVVQAAREFNYTPSLRAKGLATGRALAIGHVIPMSMKPDMVNPVFGDFIAGAGETYARNGYEMVLTIAESSNEEATYARLMARRAVDGVILHSPRVNDPRIGYLRKIGMPFAVHGRVSGEAGPYVWLDMNNTRAFEMATNLLLDLGHRRIALINGPEALDFAHRRRAGYVAALAARGIAADPALMRSDDMTEFFGYEATRDLLATEVPPTAIVCASLIIALGVRRAIEERGLTMGRDVSVVTHDDALSYLQNGGPTPIFTATRSAVREAGQKLAEMFLGVISNPDGSTPTQLLEAELIIGGSTGPAPSRG